MHLSKLFSFWGTAESAVYPDINERFATYNAGENKATYVYNNEQFVVYNYDEENDAGKDEKRRDNSAVRLPGNKVKKD